MAEILVMHPYERWMVRRYLANALKTSRFARSPRSNSGIIVWLDEHARSVGLALRAGGRRSGRSGWGDEPPYLEDWARCADRRSPSQTTAPKPSSLQRRIDWLSEACELTEGQSALLGLTARVTLSSKVSTLVEAIGGGDGLEFAGDLHPFLEGRASRDELSDQGRLAELGLIDARRAPKLSSLARRILSLSRLGARNVGDLLRGKPVQATLDWEDFAHLGDLRDLAAHSFSRQAALVPERVGTSTSCSTERQGPARPSSPRP